MKYLSIFIVFFTINFVFSGKHLSLEDLDESKNEKYVIGVSPLNSSGDCYHVLSYALLSQHHGKVTPDIVYGYDGSEAQQRTESNMNTFSQVQRTLSFFNALRCGKTLKTLKINTGRCQRENNRHAIFTQKLKDMNYTHLIDQKALTTLISEHFINHGKEKSSEMLRTGLMCGWRSGTLEEGLREKIFQQVGSDYQAIKEFHSKHKDNPLFILHVRYSSKANTNQNMDVDVMLRLKKYLAEKGYSTWFIFTDGRSNSSSFKSIKSHRTDVFPFQLQASGEDYGKLRHLWLLHKLYQNKEGLNLKGMIGNTSGTFDLAALLGHRVFNLHAFTESIVVQDMRILIQSTFMTVERMTYDLLLNELRDAKGKTGDITESILQEHLPKLTPWLEEKAFEPEVIPVLTPP